MSLSNNKYPEFQMDNSDYSKFHNINQYDQPNKFYKIGPYILDQVIGKGNFSVVKLAIHTPTQMQVAIKILHKSKMTKETLEKTYREVYIMKQLSHPYIVRLYQVIDSSDWLFIVMEYALNGELFDHLSQVGRFTEKDAKLKFGQILDAVDHCHKMNIVHRDLKAENLLLDKYHNIKLADFGFGSFYENSFLLSTWCGSPPYAAPELFKGEPYIGPKADIWSLGVILYAMVCGTLPFDEPSNIVKLREQVLSGWVRFPYFLSYECEHLIRLILNRSPMKRPTIASIKTHKWMQPIFDNSFFLMEQSLKFDNEFCDSSSTIHNAKRYNTLGGDSGFDEPMNDFSNSDHIRTLASPNIEFKDFEFNEHSLQIMERCGINRAEVCEELVNKKYGPYTATYLLLGERLRIHRQSYPPLKQDSSKSDGFYIAQSKIKSGPPNPIRFTPDITQVNPCIRDVFDNINTDYKRVSAIERNCVPKFERHSPYENMKHSSPVNIDGNNSITPESEYEVIRGYNKPFSPDSLYSDLVNIAETSNGASVKDSTSGTVDVISARDQPNQNQNCSLLSYQMPENVQLISKSRLSNSPEYVLSYPRRAIIPGPNSNITPQPCLVLDSSKAFIDSHAPDVLKLNKDNQPTTNFNPYSTFCPLQPNASCQVSPFFNYTSINHNRKNVFNDHHHGVSTRPIMIVAQSNNPSPKLKNCSYQAVTNNMSLKDQQTKNYPSQFLQKNQCIESHLLYDNGVCKARNSNDCRPMGQEIKNDNFNHSLNTVVQLENNFKKLQIINQYNTPLMIRANQYHQYTKQMIPLQPPLNNANRYSLPDSQKAFAPSHMEMPSQRVPVYNIIPISKFAATADVD